MKVFLSFFVYGSGDGDVEHELLSVSGTLGNAKIEVKKKFDSYNFYTEQDVLQGETLLFPINEKMTKENCYTFIGKRKDADEISDRCGGVGYGNCGGFIIEETEVL